MTPNKRPDPGARPSLTFRQTQALQLAKKYCQDVTMKAVSLLLRAHVVPWWCEFWLVQEELADMQPGLSWALPFFPSSLPLPPSPSSLHTHNPHEQDLNTLMLQHVTVVVP